jgi:uncharacterized protein YndB with AHSA1/START domain
MEKGKNLSTEKGTVLMERTLDAAIQKVWEALTDPHKMKLWYFDTVNFSLTIGTEFYFDAGEEGKKPFRHLCKILEVKPPHKLVYSWRYEGYEGDSVLSFELLEMGTQTKLRLTHTGLDSFPKANGEFAVDNFVGGWTHFTETGLPDYLSK